MDCIGEYQEDNADAFCVRFSRGLNHLLAIYEYEDEIMSLYGKSILAALNTAYRYDAVRIQKKIVHIIQTHFGDPYAYILLDYAKEFDNVELFRMVSYRFNIRIDDYKPFPRIHAFLLETIGF